MRGKVVVALFVLGGSSSAFAGGSSPIVKAARAAAYDFAYKQSDPSAQHAPAAFKKTVSIAAQLSPTRKNVVNLALRVRENGKLLSFALLSTWTSTTQRFSTIRYANAITGAALRNPATLEQLVKTSPVYKPE